MTSPFKDSEDEIRRVIADISVPLLVASLVHMSGSLGIMENTVRPKPARFPGDFTGSIEPADAAYIRELALPIIQGYRDRGFQLRFEPDEAQINYMTEYLVAGRVNPEYLPLINEELGFLTTASQPSMTLSSDSSTVLPVVVIGAGMSGVLMAFRLKRANIPFVVLEKNAGVGGTWYENKYPGCRVDVPSYSYQYSFIEDYCWPDLYSPQKELHRYFEFCADRFQIRSNLRLETEVTEAIYDAAQGSWTVTTQHAGTTSMIRARAIVSAVGQLNRPAIPEIEGALGFSGTQFHSARWPDDIDLCGKRVAVIGSAATAVQLIPEVAELACDVVVFQRTPNWIMIHPEYRRSITGGEKWAREHLPFFARWQRVLLFNPLRDGAADHLKIDPNWPQDGRSISAGNDVLRQRLTEGIEKALQDAPHLHEYLIPQYPPFTKRPNIGDGGFYRALQKAHVHLVTNPIARLSNNGVVDDEGREYAVDAIIYATGFQSMAFLAPMKITGVGGKDLHSFWGNEPRAYLGITVAGFPNLFCMYGPGTNLGYNGNLIFNSECQSRYIIGCLELLDTQKAQAMDVREDVYEDHISKLEAALSEFSWSHHGTGNWYRNSDGKVISNSPWRLIDYWHWTRQPATEDYIFYTRPA